MTATTENEAVASERDSWLL